MAWVDSVSKKLCEIVVGMLHQALTSITEAKGDVAIVILKELISLLVDPMFVTCCILAGNMVRDKCVIGIGLLHVLHPCW